MTIIYLEQGGAGYNSAVQGGTDTCIMIVVVRIAAPENRVAQNRTRREAKKDTGKERVSDLNRLCS